MCYNLTHDNVNDLWLEALEMVADGSEVKPRGITCFEQRAVQLVLLDPTRNVITIPERKLNYHFMVAEWLWMAGGLKDVETIAAYNKNIAKFSDDGKEFFGAYGPHLMRDIACVIALLKKDPDSRQAIVNIWRPEALYTPTKDVPCTLTWQFFIRHGRLEMIATMRSNDAWLGFPYDVFNFTQIQRELAVHLGVEPGPYVHQVGSFHLYETNEAAANLLTAGLHHESDPSPAIAMRNGPPLTQFLRGLANGELTVEGAREQLLGMPPEWWEYAGVLIHRFSKERQDLGPYFTKLIYGSE